MRSLAAKIARSRLLAASELMPPNLAISFTTSEHAALAIIAGECREHGQCELPIDAIAASAGVRRTTVQNAIRQAKALNMVSVFTHPSLPNIVRIVSREWLMWLRSGSEEIGAP